MKIWTRIENSEEWKIYGLLTKHNADTNDNIHEFVAPHDACIIDHFHWSSWALFEVVLSCLHPHTHVHFGSRLKFESFMSSPCEWSSVRSLHLDPPFLLLALPSVPFPLPQLPEVCGKPAQLLQREYGLHWRVILHHISRMKSAWRSKIPTWKIDFSVENRLRTWSAKTFG